MATGKFVQPEGFGNVVPLDVIHPDVPEGIEDNLIRYVLGDRLFTQISGQIGNGLDDGPVVGFVGDTFDKAAVDLDVIEGQVLQVLERSEAGAEVVEIKGATSIFKFAKQSFYLGEICNGGGLGNLQADFIEGDTGLLQ